MKKLPRHYYVATRSKAGPSAGCSEEFILTEGDAELTIAWISSCQAPRIQVFSDSWIGMRNWNDVIWELGNLTREGDPISPAMVESVLIERRFTELAIDA